jgi:hypothetical protein
VCTGGKNKTKGGWKAHAQANTTLILKKLHLEADTLGELRRATGEQVHVISEKLKLKSAHMQLAQRPRSECDQIHTKKAKGWPIEKHSIEQLPLEEEQNKEEDGKSTRSGSLQV